MIPVREGIMRLHKGRVGVNIIFAYREALLLTQNRLDMYTFHMIIDYYPVHRIRSSGTINIIIRGIIKLGIIVLQT